MCPRIAACIVIPSDQNISLSKTGNPCLNKSFAIVISNNRKSFGLNLSLLSIKNKYTNVITNSDKRAARVAIAAPCIPSAGAPRFPKIKTQFKNTFIQNEVIFTTTDILTSSTLLIEQSMVFSTPKNTYAHPSILKYCAPAAIISELFE